MTRLFIASIMAVPENQAIDDPKFIHLHYAWWTMADTFDEAAAKLRAHFDLMKDITGSFYAGMRIQSMNINDGARIYACIIDPITKEVQETIYTYNPNGAIGYVVYSN